MKELSHIDRVLPEGTAPPAEVPEAVFQAALAAFRSPRRLDMRALATQLGIGRATLYRRVGGRDRLLGHVLWYLTRCSVARGLEEAHGLVGVERVLAVVRHLLHDVESGPALRRFLQEEPAAALRVLTTARGDVQPRVVGLLERLLTVEEERGALSLPLDRRVLAYVLVRVCEGFLYADVIADQVPDVALAVEVVGRLLAADATAAEGVKIEAYGTRLTSGDLHAAVDAADPRREG
jgi:AcrR family transcriptional regulator